ncbi:Bgt-2620 [Blumeria graminis f. sp. tritici]|uniref:Bgt-2620 n=2 Tax=Blumeria graminis f. sp. tritici TaxID=62690 RepID=A0A061HQD3_BLUGR|nr:General amino acid permease [Blumeria graminis f. sp. tritici 96224]VDB90715.1 Bgt-2620 [Blumeria graminis f. sp. tritici]
MHRTNELDEKKPDKFLHDQSTPSRNTSDDSHTQIEKVPRASVEDHVVKNTRPTGIVRRFLWGFTCDHSTTVYSLDGKPLKTEGALQKNLKPRHLKMIAISGCVGTGLFVASGKALEAGGPASLLIAFMVIGFMLHLTMHSLGEITALYPVAGSFAAYSTRFIDPAWGFAMGWWLTVLPLEIIAASVTVNFWDSDKTKHLIFVSVFLVAIIAINLFGAAGFGEAEFIFGSIKVAAVVGFIIFGIISDCGGVPGHGYLGGTYWRDPGAFHNGFKGLSSVLVCAAFSFAGTELVGLTAAECENPSKELPKAIKQIFWRILIFYITSLILIGLLVPYSDSHLLRSGNADSMASPFVIAIERAGVSVFPSIMNAVIFVALISVGNSSVYGSSRTLSGLAHDGQAPKILGYIDRNGRPIFSMLVASVFGLLCYIVNLKSQATVLEWMLSLSGLSSVLTWGSICLAHIRFRLAWTSQGNSLEDLPYQSPYGIWGSSLALFINFLVIAAQFWIGGWPVGYRDPKQQAETFFKAFLCILIIATFYISFKIWKKTKIVGINAIDLDSDRRNIIDPREARKQLKLERESMSKPKLILSYLF